jgi:hypothetical protein
MAKRQLPGGDDPLRSIVAVAVVVAVVAVVAVVVVHDVIAIDRN